ncbi:uncharacterized histidine-rich protein DDB_G0274557-like isoform X2 [Nilaparvata lugens]|uniref:uncharacterized histidine-rich protein DDB_G0274557-like isoform X2 n=1 Tax=Nilaparvata lugens TaxID=108931 RepID=UPI00193E1B93|nr:uncharacterized histidine-rich protein DDB_G0274557-like isoform X2 [Nilaparvata lugens]
MAVIKTLVSALLFLAVFAIVKAEPEANPSGRAVARYVHYHEEPVSRYVYTRHYHEPAHDHVHVVKYQAVPHVHEAYVSHHHDHIVDYHHHH